MKLRLTMMGRRYDASVMLPDELELEAPSSLDDALQAVANALPERETLSPSCLVVLNGKHLGSVDRHENTTLAEHDELILIAPVAGG